MLQRGQKSVANLAILPPLAPGVLPEPTPDLTEEEAWYWREVTHTKPAEWWQKDSEILLKAYCRASVQHDRISLVVNSFSARKLKTEKGQQQYERVLKLQHLLSNQLCTVATKLRLCPQSRYVAERAHTVDRKAKGANPWQEPARQSA